MSGETIAVLMFIVGVGSLWLIEGIATWRERRRQKLEDQKLVDAYNRYFEATQAHRDKLSEFNRKHVAILDRVIDAVREGRKK